MFKIWYHGTNEANARSILKTGLKENSYLAAHLEDALAFGGPHVFEFALDEYKISMYHGWQIKTKVVLPSDNIVAYTVFTKKITIDNPDLRLKIFESNDDGSVDGFAGKVEEHRWK